jgi:hypothetical protein
LGTETERRKGGDEELRYHKRRGAKKGPEEEGGEFFGEHEAISLNDFIKLSPNDK